MLLSKMFRRWVAASAVAGVLAGSALMAPAGAAPVPVEVSPVGAVASSDMVRWTLQTRTNGNFRARCRKSQAWLTVTYQGAYLVVVKLAGGYPSTWSDWDDFMKTDPWYYRHLINTTEYYTHGDYIYNLGHTPLGAEKPEGTLGIAVYDRNTKAQLWWGHWYWSPSCGPDYTVTISDNTGGV